MLYVLTFVVKWLVAIIVLLFVLVSSFLRFSPTFGSQADAETMERIKRSPNFNGKTFQNKTNPKDSTMYVDYSGEQQGSGFLKNLLFPFKGKNPTRVRTEPLTLKYKPLIDGEFVWLGHSTVLFRIDGKTMITDPVFHAAAPIPLILQPFNMSHSPQVADLPFIDAVLISHDHYDHLDYKAIKKMKDSVGHFYVPLGVKAHLVRWGVDKQKVTEFDWYEEAILGGSKESSEVDEASEVRVVFTPTQHYSGRGVTNHRTSLWGSWVVKSPNLSVYFSGDGGYSSEFAYLGEKYGEFDIAFIEDGAYNLRWQEVHMLPEQSAQAGIDIGAKVVLPIHWGKYDLSTHIWTDPIQRIKLAMARHNATVEKDKQILITTPKIGQVFALDNLPIDEWWL